MNANTCPAASTSQYPGVALDRLEAMPTTGVAGGLVPVEPWKSASPKPKMPPSDATNQYPRASAVGAIPFTGLLRAMAPVEP